MTIGLVYTVLLISNAIMYSVMCIRCIMALYKNHLQKRTRILMWCATFFTLAHAHDNWVRAIGRILQHINGIVANQSNAEYALFSMAMGTLGIIVLAFGIEYSAQFGVVTGTLRRRKEDPTEKEAN